MSQSEATYREYWDKRYRAEGKIWGESPSATARYAVNMFQKAGVKSLLVPGSGYGRHTRFFSGLGFEVTGVEISPVALNLAHRFDSCTRFFNASVLDMSFDDHKYDAIYCFNVLHLFREDERRTFICECKNRMKNGGLMFFAVFSEIEPSYREGQEVEENTFESKPGRPVHYFTETDLGDHFAKYSLIDTGIIEDPEDHGGQPHTHWLRYICVRNPLKQ